jgi:tetraacyldisaccharide 4'-kinase
LPPSKTNRDRLTVWFGRGLQARLLFPFGKLFFVLAALRRAAYRAGVLQRIRLPVPVVVVGNIIAGGAGKTPLTLWLAHRLLALGRRPGIVSRGYGRQAVGVCKVRPDATASVVGDEPLLLARRSGCPVYVGSDRAAAGQALLAAHPECDLLLCDDGLQHYRLQRDVEIAVIDRRGLMNGWPLPAGPLREPVERLAAVDAVVLHDNEAVRVDGVPTFRMHLVGERFYRGDDSGVTCSGGDLAYQKLHAFAGIGDPRRFFDHLAALGVACETHAFPDHHRYSAADLQFGGDAFLTTEKDALKCLGLTTMPLWVLPVDAIVEPDLACFVLEKINGRPPA